MSAFFLSAAYSRSLDACVLPWLRYTLPIHYRYIYIYIYIYIFLGPVLKPICKPGSWEQSHFLLTHYSSKLCAEAS